MMTPITSESHSRTATRDANWPCIALIGCGAIAQQYYLPALERERSLLKNLIFVDPDRERLDQMTKKFDIKECLNDYQEAFDIADGVIIAAPTHLHHKVGMEALSRGIHVLCEKPLAEGVERAREMVEMAETSGTILATNYSQRFWPQFAKIKELAEDGSFGAILSIKYFVGELFDWPTVSGFYFNSALSSRGILRDRGAHVFDQICWWLDAKPRVILSENDSFGGSDAVAHVKFEHERCAGEVKLSWLSRFPCQFRVEFEAGVVEGGVYDFHAIRLKRGPKYEQSIGLDPRMRTTADVANRVVTNFLKAVMGVEKPLIPGSSVLPSIEFIDECYASAVRFEMPWYDLVGETNDC